MQSSGGDRVFVSSGERQLFEGQEVFGRFDISKLDGRGNVEEKLKAEN